MRKKRIRSFAQGQAANRRASQGSCPGLSDSNGQPPLSGRKEASTKNKIAPKISGDREGKLRGKKTPESSQETWFLVSALIQISLGPQTNPSPSRPQFPRM